MGNYFGQKQAQPPLRSNLSLIENEGPCLQTSPLAVEDPMDIGKRITVESLGYVGLTALLVVLFIPTIWAWQWSTGELGKTAALLIPVIATERKL